MRMIIVGVGAGPGLLTAEAAGAIAGAHLVYGSARAIALARDAIPPSCTVVEITDYRRLREIPDDAVVLSTGDPLCAGLGFLPGRVIPGISSLQLAAARLRIPWTDLWVVSAHGGDHGRAIGEAAAVCREGRVAAVLADPAFSIPDLAGALTDIGDCRLVVCERLGYDDERIAWGTPADPPIPRGDLYVVIAGRVP